MSIVTEHTAQLEVQRAIFYALSTDSVLDTLLAEDAQGNIAIFDGVPDNQAHPYIEFGAMTETDRPSTHSSIGREVTVTLHVWGRTSRAEVHQINNQIIQSLERQPLLGMAGWDWTSTQLEMAEVMRDPDGISWHGVLRFRCRVSRLS